MLESLAVIHVPGSRKTEIPPRPDAEGSWVHWKTCLRSIWIGVSPSGFSEVDYGFLLEVVCGLRSPLAGETEVMGQFRELVARLPARSELFGLREVFRDLLTDAKSIRRDYLTNLGSQSYGSLTRKVLKNSERIHLLGSGKLAEEILPWLRSFRSVEVFCRSPEKRDELSRKFPDASFAPLDVRSDGNEEPVRNALVVAAPMGSAEIVEWVDRHGHRFDMLVDLRGEAETDPIPDFVSGLETIRLRDFFSSMEANLETIRERVGRARAEIGEISRSRANRPELRPFGWDDLCG
jgi:glutamyl-tRNA reductase